MKNTQLYSAATALVCSLALSASALAEATFLSGNDRNAVYDTSGIAAVKGSKWVFHTGDIIYASPVEAAGNIYIGSGDGNFYAIDAETGAEKWRFKTGGAIHSSAAIAEKIVYFLSRDAYLYALDIETGEKIWSAQTGGESTFSSNKFNYRPVGVVHDDLWDFYMSSPLVDNGTVYFGSSDTHLYALDAKSGDQKWKYKADDVIHASPSLEGDVLFISDFAGNVHAVNAADGAQVWKYSNGLTGPFSAPFMASPTVANGMIYIGGRDAVMHGIDAKTGEELMNFSTGGSWILATATVADGTVYFGDSDGRALYAIDAKTGAQKFRRIVKAQIYSSPALSNNIVYFGSFEGRLNAIAANDGTRLWTFETQGYQQNKDTMLSATGSLNLKKVNNGAAVNASDYDILSGVWAKSHQIGSIVSSPLIGDGVIYFGAGDGNVYAIEGE